MGHGVLGKAKGEAVSAEEPKLGVLRLLHGNAGDLPISKDQIAPTFK